MRWKQVCLSIRIFGLFKVRTIDGSACSPTSPAQFESFARLMMTDRATCQTTHIAQGLTCYPVPMPLDVRTMGTSGVAFHGTLLLEQGQFARP